MNEKKKLRTRKQVALRRSAIALALLVFINVFAGFGYLLPRQAVRAKEQERGIRTKTEVLETCGCNCGRLAHLHRYYLTGNEHVMMLNDVQFTLFGWLNTGGLVLDCSGDEAVYLGVQSSHEEEMIYLWGCVRDEHIVKLELTLQSHEDDGGSRGSTVSIPIEDKQGVDGERWFFHRITERNFRPNYNMSTQLRAYDATGQILLEKAADQYNIDVQKKIEWIDTD